MDNTRNEAESSAAQATAQEDTAPDQQSSAESDQKPAVFTEPAPSEAASIPDPTATSEGIKSVEGGKEPEKVEETQDDTAPQQDAASEDEEEGKAEYRSGGYHPVYIGDIFNDRYKVLNKIGYGRYSTVWLVKDLQAT